MNTLYVTTFTYEMFNASGKIMIESFMKNKIEGKILVCSEFFNYNSQDPDHLESRKSRRMAHKHKKIISYNMTNDNFLNAWLEKHKSIIPVHMGGAATIENCPRAFGPGNIRAAGWFRKIVALNHALQYHGKEFDCIVFVDSDCIFKKSVDSSMIKKAFSDGSCFYHLGKSRRKKGMGVESGFVGFKNDEDGYKLLDIWISKYRDGSFQNYDRWDDGGMLRYVIDENPNIGAKDLVRDYKQLPDGKGQSHVIDRGMFCNHIEHYKGLHKNLGIGKENNFKKHTMKIKKG